jgi:hypothetical protein
MSIASQKSAVSLNLYSASILSSNTSIEGSPLKRPLTFHNNEDNDVTAESEESSENETTAIVSDKDIDKESLVEPSDAESQEEREKEDEREKNNEIISDEMDTQVKIF